MRSSKITREKLPPSKIDRGVEGRASSHSPTLINNVHSTNVAYCTPVAAERGGSNKENRVLFISSTEVCT